MNFFRKNNVTVYNIIQFSNLYRIIFYVNIMREAAIFRINDHEPFKNKHCTSMSEDILYNVYIFYKELCHLCCLQFFKGIISAVNRGRTRYRI